MRRYLHAFGQRHRRQLQAPVDVANHIADRQHRGHVGTKIRIHRNRAIGGLLNARLRQPEAVGIGAAAGGKQHAIGVQHAVVIQCHLCAAAAGGHRRYLRLQTNGNALLLHFARQHGPEFGIHAAQQAITPMQQRHLTAEAIQDRRQFHRDIAAAGHHCPRRQTRHGKERIGTDGMADTR